MKTHKGKFQHFDDVEYENVADGIRRKIMGYDGQIMAVYVDFQQGAIAPAHDHYHSQVTYVVSGKFKVTIDGESEIVTAGDTFYVEPDLWHWAECIEAGVLIDTFSPHRADFLVK